MADITAHEFLKHHGLERIECLLRTAGIRFDDFWYLKANIIELQGIMPNIRDRMDFIRSLNNNVADKECQVNLPAPICMHEVSSL